MSDPAPISPSTIDADNPWPGLATFTEDQGAYFHGRDDEIDDLTQLARLRALVVLFGQSGLGKSSLLQAGVFPRLRANGFCPIYIRLDHAESAPSPTDQIKTLLLSETAKVGTWTKPGTAKPGETLWELFHHRDDRLIGSAGRAIIPVLVFDQFEELFTLGAAAGARRDRAVAFMSELAELVENRPSEQLVARLEGSADELEAFDFSRADYRVVITLREDFLPELEGLKTIMPAMMANRMRLARMTGTQALQAVVKPGAALVSEDVACKIVEFVAGARGGSIERLAELNVEPALLSVVCRELNERRRALGQTQITADLVSGNRREILTDFYERSVNDLPAGMRAFVEDRLLTKSGFRDNLALESALEFPDVTQPLIDTLVSRRLLRIEDRAGIQRVELTHDVLAEVIRASRDERQQRFQLAAAASRTRRLRVLVGGLAAAVIAIGIGAFWGVRSQRLAAQQALKLAAHRASQSDVVFASRLLEEGKVPDGLAYLVRAARRDPENSTLAPRLLTTLADRNFLLPDTAPLAMPTPLYPILARSADGSTLLTQGDDWAFRVVDLRAWRIAREFRVDSIQPFSNWALATGNDRVLAVTLEDGGIRIYDPTTGLPRTPPLRPATLAKGISLFPVLSPDGRWVAAGAAKTIWLWDTETGALRTTLSDLASTRVGFTSDSQRMVTWETVTSNQDYRPRFRSLPDGAEIGRSFGSDVAGQMLGQEFSPDGKLWAAVIGQKIHLFDVETGAAKGPPISLPALGTTNVALTFTADGQRLLVQAGRTIHVVDLAGGQLAFPPLIHSGVILPPQLSRDGKLLLAQCLDGFAWLWDLETGKLRAEPTLQHEHYATAALAPDGSQVVVFDTNGRAFRLAIGRGARESLALTSTFSSIATTFVRDAPNRVLRRLGRKAEVIDVTTGRSAPGGFSYPRVLVSDTGTTPVPVTTYTAEDQRRIVGRAATAPAEWRSWKLDDHGKVIENVVLEGVPPPTISLQFRPPGDIAAIWIAQGLERDIGIWNLQTGKRDALITRPEGIASNAIFSRDGRALAFRTQDDAIHIADFPGTADRCVIRETGQTFITQWRFSHDGKQFITGDVWGTVSFWDANDGRRISSTPRHRVQVLSLIATRDGAQLLSVAWDGSMQVWNVATRAPVGALIIGNAEISTAVFSSDGRRIATGSSAGDVRVWDVATGQPLTAPVRHDGAGTSGVTSVQIGSDGRFLLSNGGANSSHRVWAMPPDGNGAAAPEWLLRLATACASKRLTEDGEMVSAADDVGNFEVLRREIAALPAAAPFAEWGRWFVADRATRSIAPGFTLTPAEARKLTEELSAPDPIVAMTTRDNALLTEGKYAESEPVEREMLAWVIKGDGEGSENAGTHQIKLAQTLVMVGKFEEAEALARSSLAIREKTYAGNTTANALYSLASSRATIGSALVGQKRYAEAEPLLAEACELFKERDATTTQTVLTKQQMKNRVASLVQLYEATGRPEKAAEWKVWSPRAAGAPAPTRPSTPAPAAPKQ